MSVKNKEKEKNEKQVENFLNRRVLVIGGMVFRDMDSLLDARSSVEIMEEEV